MIVLISLVEQIAPGLYILIAVGIIRYFYKWMNARRAYRATTFELERDLARYESGMAFTIMVVLAEVFLIVMGIQTVVAPTIQADREIMGEPAVELVQEEAIFATPTRAAPSGGAAFDPSGVDFGNDNELQIFATAVLTATPVGTIEPNAPESVGCNTPNAMLQIPANGMRVFQPIRVAGTAYAENFSSYKLEIGRPGGQFSVVDTGTLPVEELGTLTQFNPTPYEPGTYQFRLMIFDTTDQLVSSCQVTIYISDPIPTATPIGGL